MSEQIYSDKDFPKKSVDFQSEGYLKYFQYSTVVRLCQLIDNLHTLNTSQNMEVSSWLQSLKEKNIQWEQNFSKPFSDVVIEVRLLLELYINYQGKLDFWVTSMLLKSMGSALYSQDPFTIKVVHIDNVIASLKLTLQLHKKNKPLQGGQYQEQWMKLYLLVYDDICQFLIDAMEMKTQFVLKESVEFVQETSKKISELDDFIAKEQGINKHIENRLASLEGKH